MVADLGADLGFVELQSEANGSVAVSPPVLDGVREQLADEQADGEACLGIGLEPLESVDRRARLRYRPVDPRQIELQLSPVESSGHCGGLPRSSHLYRRRVESVDARVRQVAENEVRFRALNERLQARAGTWEGSEGELNLVCECGDEDCVTAIALNAREYEAVRAVETQFVVTLGHERVEFEDIVGGDGEWLIVRKRGEAAAIAAETDPRA